MILKHHLRKKYNRGLLGDWKQVKSRQRQLKVKCAFLWCSTFGNNFERQIRHPECSVSDIATSNFQHRRLIFSIMRIMEYNPKFLTSYQTKFFVAVSTVIRKIGAAHFAPLKKEFGVGTSIWSTDECRAIFSHLGLGLVCKAIT